MLWCLFSAIALSVLTHAAVDLLHYSVWVDWSITTLLLGIVCGVTLNSGGAPALMCLAIVTAAVRCYYRAGAAVAATIPEMVHVKYRLDAEAARVSGQ